MGANYLNTATFILESHLFDDKSKFGYILDFKFDINKPHYIYKFKNRPSLFCKIDPANSNSILVEFDSSSLYLKTDRIIAEEDNMRKKLITLLGDDPIRLITYTFINYRIKCSIEYNNLNS